MATTRLKGSPADLIAENATDTITDSPSTKQHYHLAACPFSGKNRDARQRLHAAFASRLSTRSIEGRYRRGKHAKQRVLLCGMKPHEAHCAMIRAAQREALGVLRRLARFDECAQQAEDLAQARRRFGRSFARQHIRPGF